jgi:photosystem II stability/assembly factor-like uncharacterized protein
MPDRHDDVDAWLSERIEPLPPPPGTFDLIKRRARRRKYRKLAITAGSAAVIVAAAVTVPQVVNLPVLNPNPTAAPVAGAQNSTATPSVGRAAAGKASPVTSSAVPLPASVPGNFRPTSVTFVSTRTGWAIGQALTPGHCATQVCTSVARTSNAGRTWTGVPAPMAGAPDGATGLSQIRFLNLDDGWAYGPQLYVTHNSGKTWAQVDTAGLRVTALETVGDRVFAVWASCTGDGPAYAVNCTRFTLYSAPATGGAWAPVGAPTTGLTDGAASEAAELVLTGSRGYLLAPGGALYSGPVDGTGPWTRVSSLAPSCPVGTPRANGQPTGALLGAVNASHLILACVSASSGTSPSVSTQQKFIYSSKDGGRSWEQTATAPAAGVAFGLAASPAESVVLATNQGIDVLPAGETTWRKATIRGGAPADGFRYIGMTTDEQGIALPADPSAGTIWFTFDGGQTWTASRLNGS